MIESTVVNYIAPIVNKMPYLDLSGIFDQPGVQTVIDILSAISYFFPWSSVLVIVGIMISINTIRLIVAFLKLVMDIIPFV